MVLFCSAIPRIALPLNSQLSTSKVTSATQFIGQGPLPKKQKPKDSLA
uniref:Uncharacterized protein n=1 Tax=Marmota marmota marmota TaxID=9994 RepID=A0A8C5ZE14_MARMA